MRVLLADDEPLVLAGLKSLIDWEAEGFEVIGTARNGEKALELIEEYEPQLVISDIKMPRMDGLELATECRERYGPLPAFILLTAYEDFEMVRTALNLGAVDYLIKLELSPELLQKTVRRAKAEIEKEELISRRTEPVASNRRAEFRSRFFVRLFNHLIPEEEEVLKQAGELGLDLSEAPYQVLYIRLNNVDGAGRSYEEKLKLYSGCLTIAAEQAAKSGKVYPVSLDLRHFVLFLSGRQTAPALETAEDLYDLLKRYFSVSSVIGIGQPVSEIMAAGNSYQQARTLCQNAAPGQAILEADRREEGEESFVLADYRKDLLQAFSEPDADALEKVVRDMRRVLESNPDRLPLAMDACTNLLYIALSSVPDAEKKIYEIFADEPDGYRSLYRKRNVAQCLEWMEQFSEGLCRLFRDMEEHPRSGLIAEVKAYIDANADKKLSLNHVAEVFNFSPNYLSQLFTKNSSMSFVEYVTESKIRVAKKLLTESSLKVYEISERLAFESPFYFSKVFKKSTGQSPRDYMKSHRRF